MSAAAAVSIEKLKISVRVEFPFWADPTPALAEPTLAHYQEAVIGWEQGVRSGNDPEANSE